MSILPTFNEIEIEVAESRKVELPVYKEIAWDFKENKPIIVDGNFKVVEKNEALKTWIYKAIKTERFRYGIYSWDYGSEIESLINKGFTKDLIKSEVERFITEALSTNEYILSINYVDVNFNNDLLNVDISLSTIYGEVKANV